MKKRIDIIATQPEAYEAMSAMENDVKNRMPSPIYQELIKIRPSKVTASAGCINMYHI